MSESRDETQSLLRSGFGKKAEKFVLESVVLSKYEKGGNLFRWDLKKKNNSKMQPFHFAVHMTWGEKYIYIFAWRIG